MYWVHRTSFLKPFSCFRLTCAYLSCKVDEFNVSCTQFVGNLVQESPAGQERVLEQILEFELLLIQQLNFHLVVHNPYRPMEGLLIDLKVSGLQNSDWYFCMGKICPVLLNCCLCINVLPLDQIPHNGESRVTEEGCWWLYDTGILDRCGTAVSSVPDCFDSHSEQRLKSRP